MSLEKRFARKIVVPSHLLLEEKMSKRFLLPGVLSAAALFAIRTFAQIKSNPQGFKDDIFILKAFFDQILTGFQMAPTPERLSDPMLLSVDTLAGLGIALTAGVAVTGGVALSNALGKERRLKEEILEKGKLENPLELVGHTVLLAQKHPFLNGILEDLTKVDNIEPFLISKTGGNQFNPYENRTNDKPSTRFWKSTGKPYDDKNLRIADLEKSSRMIILGTETDKLILSNKQDVGLSLTDIENTLVTTYKIRQDIQTMLILPSRQVIDDQFIQSLIKQGVPFHERVKIIFLDDLVAEQIKIKSEGKPVGIDVGEFEDNMRNLLSKSDIQVDQSNIKIIYGINDAEVLKKARRAKAEGLKPIAIIDTKDELNEMKDEGIDYICAETLMRSAIEKYSRETLPEKKSYSFSFSNTERITVQNVLEPLSMKKKAAREIVRKAINTLGKEEFFRLMDLIPETRIDMVYPNMELEKLSYRWHEKEFTRGVKGKHYSITTSNSRSMKRALRENGRSQGVEELIADFFGYRADKKTLKDFSLVMQALYILGFIYKDFYGLKNYEITRYPINMRSWMPKVNLCEAD